MKIDEAKEWFEDKRDMINMIPDDPKETWEIRIQEANLYKIQQAYWTLRAHKEGLLD